mgnify:CR=1 FL=1
MTDYKLTLTVSKQQLEAVSQRADGPIEFHGGNAYGITNPEMVKDVLMIDKGDDVNKVTDIRIGGTA